MKRLIIIIAAMSFFLSSAFAQYYNTDILFSIGTNYSKYFGTGEGKNTFDYDNPGFQAELSVNSGNGFEWVIYGVQFFESYNIAGGNRLPVKFSIPYYTEFVWYQKNKASPMFIFFGYDYVRMKFEDMEKPDSHYNISFGGGWNIRLIDQVYLQLKLKPYFIIDNSVGQWYGFNAFLNIRFALTKHD